MLVALFLLPACALVDGTPRRVTIDSDDPDVITAVQQGATSWNRHSGLRVFASVQLGKCTDEDLGAVCVRSAPHPGGDVAGNRHAQFGDHVVTIYTGDECHLGAKVLHELGHVIEVGHDKVEGSVMRKRCMYADGMRETESGELVPDAREIQAQHIEQVRDTFKGMAEVY